MSYQLVVSPTPPTVRSLRSDSLVSHLRLERIGTWRGRAEVRTKIAGVGRYGEQVPVKQARIPVTLSIHRVLTAIHIHFQLKAAIAKYANCATVAVARVPL